MNTQPKRIVVCRSDAIGDAILTLPVCQLLKKNVPHLHLTMLVSKYAQSAIEDQPGIDQLLVYDRDDLHAGRRGLTKIVKQLKTGNYDTALMVFPDRRISWAVFLAGINRRIGTGRRWWSLLYNQRIKHSRSSGERHEVDFNLDFVRALGHEVQLEAPKMIVDQSALKWAEEFLEKKHINCSKPLVIVHPGGRGSSANWVPEAYAELIRFLKINDELEVLLTGGPNEQLIIQAVKRMSGVRVHCLDETVTLKQLSALISKTKVFVSGNTGPMHIAAALGKSLVAIFPPLGVTGPKRWRPLGPSTCVITSPTLKLPIDAQDIDPQIVADKVKQFVNG